MTRYQCRYCKRRIYIRDFRRQLATSVQEWSNTFYEHTYDCNQVIRRYTKRRDVPKKYIIPYYAHLYQDL